MVQRTLNGDENMKALIFNGSKEGNGPLNIAQEVITQKKDIILEHLHEYAKTKGALQRCYNRSTRNSP